jgi:hypothetical protein
MSKIFIAVALLCATLSLHSAAPMLLRLMMTPEIQETPPPGQSTPLCRTWRLPLKSFT